MEDKNTILEELRSISPVVAGIGNQNPYLVPAGYFDHLPVQVMLRIALEEKSGADPLLNISRNNVYQVPESYFDAFAGNLVQRIKMMEEDATEELESLSPVLNKIGRKNPFSAPEGYFNDFSENMMAGVKAIEFVNEELENLSPVMINLQDKQVYEAPPGYFDTTAAAILQKVKQQEPAKVISFGFGKKIMRYAAAAMLAGIALLAGYQYSGKKADVATDIAAVTAKIPDQEIESFLSNNTVALSDVGADADSLNTPATVDETAVNADDTKDLLANVSDEELQKYVDQQSETPLTN